MFEKYFQLLKGLRNGLIRISDFDYSPFLNAENHTVDTNNIKRFQLLFALQYDSNIGDEECLKHLLDSEIVMHEKAAFQGLSPSISLCAYLLSKFQNPSNVWLFTRAKKANFDTHCGLDVELLVSAGISSTYDFIENSNDELISVFKDYVGETKETC